MSKEAVFMPEITKVRQRIQDVSTQRSHCRPLLENNLLKARVEKLKLTVNS